MIFLRIKLWNDPITLEVLTLQQNDLSQNFNLGCIFQMKVLTLQQNDLSQNLEERRKKYGRVLTLQQNDLSQNLTLLISVTKESFDFTAK